MDVLTGYRTQTKVSSDDESDDSDKECFDWKRAINKTHEDSPVQTVEIEEKPSEKPKRKRNTIWSDILQDQLISEEIGSVLLKNKPANYGSRGHESYDYTLKYAEKKRKLSDNQNFDCNMSEGEDSDKKSTSSRKSFRSKKYVELDNVEKDAVRKINKVLNEQKVYLICRVVKYLGIEKAIQLLKMTEEVEENGGMMISNNARRRTAGGVYIQLLKTDKNVSKEILDKIFEGELTGLEQKKYFDQKKLERKMYKKQLSKLKKLQKNSKSISKQQEIEKMDDIESEVVTEEISEDVMLERNPPPSPVSFVPEKNDSELEDGELDD